MLFGSAHVGGGWTYVGLAAIAGIGYGWIYAATGAIGASILAHTGLNLLHLLFFSYPALPGRCRTEATTQVAARISSRRRMHVVIRRSLDVPSELLEEFRRCGTVTAYLVAVLPPALWQAPPPGRPRGRTIAAITAHIQGVRRTFARLGGARPGPSSLDRKLVTQDQASLALLQSTDILAELFESAIAAGHTRVKGMPRRVVNMLTYLMQHDAHHRGQIVMLAGDLGHRLSGDETMRIWGWKAMPPPVAAPPARARGDARSSRMAHLELMTLVVREYEPAIDFFVNVLQFDLVEDVPSLTNDGRPKRWVVVRPPGATTGLLLARADGDDQAAVVGRQFAGRVGLLPARRRLRCRLHPHGRGGRRLRHAATARAVRARRRVPRPGGEPLGPARPRVAARPTGLYCPS